MRGGFSTVFSVAEGRDLLVVRPQEIAEELIAAAQHYREYKKRRRGERESSGVH